MNNKLNSTPYLTEKGSDSVSYETCDTKKHESKFQFETEIPNLLDVQRQSFYTFLQEGIKKAFQHPFLFSTHNQKLEITFFPELLQFQKPEFTQKQAVILGKTYGSSIYIPIGIKSTNSSTLRVEWFLVGILPLMTKHGHFVINGIPRVVLHQMVRNPGIYTIPRDSRTQTATIRIVPEKGGWINLTVDKKNRVWFSTRTLRRKVSLLIILQALGISHYELSQRLNHSEILQNSLINELSTDSLAAAKTRHDKILIRANLQRHPRNQQEAWHYLYAHFMEYSPYARTDSVTSQSVQDFFWNTLWNKDLLVLGQIGRQQFREKVGSPEQLGQFSLTLEDLLAATQALLNLIYKERLADEIDSLTQKRIRGCDEFLLEQLIRGIKEFEIFFTRKINTLPVTKSEKNSLEILWKQNKAVFSKIVTKSWKSFFTSGTLAQFMDQTNPLAETTHKRRLTVLGPGGINNKQTTIQIRGIHPTFYGRLCPIETPEGQNAGLVNSFTVLSRCSKNVFGTLFTPFYQVYKGQVQKEISPLCVSPQQEYRHVTAPGDLYLTRWNLLPKTPLPVRKELNFDYAVSSRITTQALGILQTISVATSLIPFLEHDDANRALMGSNMQRQAVPLIRPEASLVGTGLETRVVSDVNHVIQASQSGYLYHVTSTDIQTIRPSSLHQKQALPKNSWVLNKRSEKLDFRSTLSNFRTKGSFYFGSKMNILGIKQAPFPQQKCGDSSFLAYSQSERGNPTPFFWNNSFGAKSKQLKTEKGVPENFGEQANSKLFPSVKTDLYQKQVDLTKVKTLKSSTAQKVIHSNLTRYQRTNQSTCISERPVLSETEWVEKGDIIADGAASLKGKLAIGKNVLVAYLPWEGYNFEDAILISERLVNQDIFTSLHIDHYDIEVKNTQHGLEIITNHIPLKIDESTRDILKIEKLNSKGLIEIGSWVEEGDYLVGKISPLNPKGPSVEQQYEKLYNVIMQREKTNFRNTSLRVPKGVEGFVLDVQILPSREPDVAALAEKESILRVRVVLLQRRRIQVGDKMAGRHGNKGIVSNILPQHDMPYLPDGTPIDIVLNPLGVPSRMNVGQILECLLGLAGLYLQEKYTTHLFDEQFGAEASRSLVYSKLYEASVKTSKPWLFEPHHPGKIKLFDGRTGLPFDQPITVGFAYILKLVHLVDDKIHARATGPYSAVTQQPVRGRSRNGGQRLGEMEVWALQAYGAAYTLQELLTLKSDDIEGRKEAVFSIYGNKPVPSGRPESFKVLLRELQALCFDLQLYGIHEKTGLFGPFMLTKLENLR
uniref:DNA-directed RNA polymerase subunit beta n=1 Tax=Chlorella heliozoae TaxID=554066 RepID=A0A2I4S8W8_9CHLO|nr:RNA polymerase beta subunit [Chlorella heliozoae]AST08773.1 RNA polymerase beta subunit [Chlorella heliozoae]